MALRFPNRLAPIGLSVDGQCLPRRATVGLRTASDPETSPQVLS